MSKTEVSKLLNTNNLVEICESYAEGRLTAEEYHNYFEGSFTKMLNETVFSIPTIKYVRENFSKLIEEDSLLYKNEFRDDIVLNRYISDGFRSKNGNKVFHYLFEDNTYTNYKNLEHAELVQDLAKLCNSNSKQNANMLAQEFYSIVYRHVYEDCMVKGLDDFERMVKVDETMENFRVELNSQLLFGTVGETWYYVES